MRRQIDIFEAQQQFIAAMRDGSLTLGRELIADGRIHRCDAANKEEGRGKNDGSYVIHLTNCDWPYGGFQNHTLRSGWTNWRYADSLTVIVRGGFDPVISAILLLAPGASSLGCGPPVGGRASDGQRMLRPLEAASRRSQDSRAGE